MGAGGYRFRNARLMWIDKAEHGRWPIIGDQLDLVREETLTCYNGIKAMAVVIARPVICALTA